MDRDRTGPLVLFGLLAACGALVWLMYHPEWPPLEQAGRLPVVGPYVERFREYCTPPEPAESRAVRQGRVPKIEVIIKPPRTPDARPRIWIRPGTTVRDLPSSEAAVVGRVEALSNLRWIEHRGDWYRVAFGASGLGEDLVGWVFVDDPAASFPTRPPTVEPAGPLPANSIDSAVLRTARTLMGGDAVGGNCGPYGLLTDVEDSGLEALCEELVTRVDGAFARRFGRDPVGAPAETLLVFGEQRDFEIFVGGTSRWRVETSGRASAAEGYVALPWEARERDELARTLVHELTHLVSRRSLGPALPPWLDEGMADELAERMVGGKYQAAVWQAEMDRASGDLLPLAELFDLDRSDFYGERGFASYAQALLVVRYLSEHPELGDGFQRFLDSLAAGATYAPEVVRRHLGRSRNELQRNWDAWGRGRHQSFRPFAERPVPVRTSSSRQAESPSR